ncbi:MAG: uroporphyrinogen decarboxylase family protein [Candidatus Omnitrophica bacterium]|nr:uroporphyrinogen decarboxylase family protein [Candidatus Omnitrophota bacterium]
MDSRKRCRTAMTGGIPDFVPVIPQICHPHAIKALGLNFRKTMIEAVKNPELVNKLQIECARYYGADGVRIWIHQQGVQNLYDDGENVWQIDSISNKYIGRLDFKGGGWIIPLKEETLVENEYDLDKIPVIPASEFIKTESFKKTKKLVQNARNDLFVITSPGCISVEFATVVRGKQQTFIDLVENPDFVHKILYRATQAAIQKALAMVEAGVDAFMLGETFGGVIGPEHFKKFCVPYFKMFVDKIKKYDVCIYLHVCGNSTKLFELMADTGVDCIEPLDPLGGVDIADVKRRVGKKVSLMGGVNTLKLATGTLEEVRQDINRCLSEGAPGGGYILACGDMLPTETSPEKVFEMVRTAHSYRYT